MTVPSSSMGNAVLSNRTPILIWSDETNLTINPKVKFPPSGRLVVPIRNIINSIGDIYDCFDGDTYVYTLEECKNLVSKYPIDISLRKEDYRNVLCDFNSETMIDMFNFVIENSPKHLVEWDYEYAKSRLPKPIKSWNDASCNFAENVAKKKKFHLYDYPELIDDVNKLFKA